MAPSTREETLSYLRRESLRLSRKVIRNYNNLHEITRRHERTFRKRWVAKNKRERRNILAHAWPNMVESRPVPIYLKMAEIKDAKFRPAFHEGLNAKERKEVYNKAQTDLIEDEKEVEKQRKQLFDMILCPEINLEVLCKERPLQLMLESRGKAIPERFVWQDTRGKLLVRKLHGTNQDYHLPAYVELENTVMAFAQTLTPQDYGEVREYDGSRQNRAMLELTHKALRIHQGFAVLKTQERITKFLLKCCKSVLRPGDVFAAAIKKLVGGALDEETSPVPLESYPGLYDSVTRFTEEAPYKLPADVDFGDLAAEAALKVEELQSHLTNLHEDPGYFAETLKAHMDHHLAHVLDEYHQKGEYMDESIEALDHPQSCWHSSVHDLVCGGYSEASNWMRIYSQMERLQTLQEQYKSQIIPYQRLPTEYLEYLDETWNNLEHVLELSVKSFVKEVAACKHFREGHMRYNYNHSVRPRQESRIYRDRGVSSFLETLNLLAEGASAWQQWFSAHALLDSCQHLVQTDDDLHSILCPYIINKLSTLALLGRVYDRLRNYGSWGRQLENMSSIRQDSTFVSPTGKFDTTFDCALNMWPPHLTKLAFPLKKFEYPADEKRTKETTDQMRAAEAQLDSFWAEADKHVRQERLEQKQDLFNVLYSNAKMERTDEWEDPLPGQKSVPIKTNVVNYTDKYREWALKDTTLRKSPKKAPKEDKKKTQGLADPNRVVVPAPAPPAQEPVPQVYYVSADALEVFEFLIYTPGAGTQRGEIPWDDLLKAMEEVGFGNMKQGSSAWRFTPGEQVREKLIAAGLEDRVHPVTLHEPHGPQGTKLKRTWARNSGRYISRIYNWVPTTFQLREDNPAPGGQ